MCGIQLKQCLQKKRRECIVLNICIRREFGNYLIVHLKRLEKKKSNLKRLKEKAASIRMQQFKTLSKILSTICSSKDERMIGL